MIDSPGNGLLRVSTELAANGIRQVVSMSFEVDIAGDGTVTSTIKQATAGRIRLPTAAAIRLVARHTHRDGGAQQRGQKTPGEAGNNPRGALVDLMRGRPVAPIQLPIDPTQDGLRDGRLVGLEVREDALLVTRETVRRDRPEQGTGKRQ